MDRRHGLQITKGCPHHPGAGSAPEFTVNAEGRLPDRDSGGVILEAEPDGDHMADFFDCVRSRRQPRANVEAGFAHALATTMAGVSMRLGARIEYDATTDTVRPTGKS